ncbi:hypothetical protein Tco_0360125 [Tanacetum coccineum]
MKAVINKCRRKQFYKEQWHRPRKERIKKQKMDDDQEEAEMKKHMEIVFDEKEIAVDDIKLATKPPIIGLESVRYGVSKVLDTVYWGFLGAGTTFDIFQNILFPYSLNTAYCLLLDTAY